MRQHQPTGNRTVATVASTARLLRSRRFAVVLLVLVVSLCGISLFAPDRDSPAYEAWRSANPALARLAGWFGFADTFRSPFFLVLLVLLGLSLGLSILDRAKGLAPRRGGRGWVPSVLAHHRLAGSLLFHAGLLGLLLAAAVSALTRAEGNVLLTEGQALAVGEEQLHATSRPAVEWDAVAPFEIRLDRFHPVHEGGWGTPDYASDVTVFENGREVRKARVRVNEPLRHRGVTFYQQVHGFSPLIVLRDETGRSRFGSWVAFGTDFESDPVRYADEFEIPGSRVSVRAELFPDAYMVGDKLANRSPDPRNPALMVTVSEESGVLYEGPVYEGKPVRLREGLLLSLEGVRYWSGFDTVRDSGMGILILSAWVAVAGLCIRFAPKRSIPSRSLEAR